MKNSILIASLFVVALAACSKKEETAAPAVEPAAPVITEQAPAAAPAPVEPAPTEPAPAAAPAPADATVAPATEEKK